jgi:hypothetical protein
MKKILMSLFVASMFLVSFGFVAANGFDEFGYNYKARIFVGIADGFDGFFDGKLWGDPTYANDYLVVKWSKDWELACDLGLSCEGAWYKYEFNGMVPNGSGAVWIQRLEWTNSCNGVPNGEILPDGGYCLWGTYKVIMDQGKDPNYSPGHIWGVHAIPTGNGN